MRDFTVEDISAEIQKELPVLIPKRVITGLIIRFFKHIKDNIKKPQKCRYIMKQLDLNHVYPDINEEEELLIMMDLDETKELTEQQQRVLREIKIYERKTFYHKTGYGSPSTRVSIRRRDSRRVPKRKT